MLLYPFLKRTTNAPRINAGLLKALARIGDAQTLELIKPFRESHQPYVAEAAEIAHDEIEKRLGEPAPDVRRAREHRETLIIVIYHLTFVICHWLQPKASSVK